MKRKHNEFVLSLIMVVGIIAFSIHQFVYENQRIMDVLMNMSYLLAVTVPFLLYILFVSRKERKRLLNKIFQNSLTGLPNREKLRLDSIKPNASLFLVNIDAFKEFNDFYGYTIGDYIICELAERLSSLIRSSKNDILKNAVLYKLEIDEYAILIKKYKSKEKIQDTAIELSHAINDRSFIYKNNEMAVTVTIGIALADGESEKLSVKEDRAPGILARADMALKTAKNNNYPYLIYNDSMQIPQAYQDNIRWTKKLKESIKKDHVHPYFQPIVNNRTGKVDKYECLIRIVDEEDNILYPSSFLRISKRSHLYPELTKIMIDRAFDEICRTQNFEFSINISIEDIQNKDTVSYIYNCLENNSGVAHRLCFELLETEYIESLEIVKTFIYRVRQFGCSISIDDFGRGYSNFNYLTELEVDYIKLDSSLIRHLDENQNARIITETIYDFCKKLGVKTIAEFVHSRKIQQIVKEIGIDYSQGFYLGRPMKSSIEDNSSNIRSILSGLPAANQ